MVGTSIKDLIKKLVDLQKIDAEIYEFKNQLKEKPIFLDELKQQFESTKATLNALEEKSKHIQVARKQLELDLQSKEGEIGKSNADLSKLKTNKEYTAKLQEIESLKADKSIIEEKILNSYDASDEVNAKINTEKVNVAGKEKEYLEQKKKIDEEIRGLVDKTKVLESQRQQVVPEIDPNYLTKYEKILHNKEGKAIVPVVNHSCDGCYMNVPQQTINTMKMHDQLIMCEMCARILYLEEDI